MADTAPPPVLRPAVDADRDAIADIWHRSASLPGVGPHLMPTRAALRQELDTEATADWAVTVAVSGGSVSGFMAIKPREAILAELFICPEWIGAGIGRRLLAAAMTAMPTGFTLFTRPSNIHACRFYERAGLVAIGGGVHPRTGEPIVWYCWQPVAANPHLV